MHLDDSRAIFYIPSLLKQSRPGYHQKPLEFKAYPQETKLCPVMMLQKYITYTKKTRVVNSYTKLFLSYGKPFKPVGSTTIARWVTDILEKCGIDIKTFSAHSTRSASTSKAKHYLSLSEISNAAGWSGVRTFAKHYDKPILKNFGETILD